MNRHVPAPEKQIASIDKGRRRISGWEIAAWGAVATGILFRCLPWRFVFRQDGVFFPGLDAYYHVYRARWLVENFPNWSLWDPMIRHPLGAPSPYLVGFDVLLALPGLLGLGQGAVEIWAALLPPLLGGVAVYLVYRLGKYCLGVGTGLVASYLFAIMTGAVNFNLVGRADHHAMVAPMELGSFLLLLMSLGNSKKKTVLAAAAGFLAGWSVAVWVVTPPFYYFVPVAFLVGLCLLGKGQEISKSALYFSVSAAIAATAAVVVAGDLARWPHELTLPSSVAILVFWGAVCWIAVATFRPRFSILLASAMAGGFLIILKAFPAMAEPWKQLWEIATGVSKTFIGLPESESILEVGGTFTLDRLVAYYTNLAIFSPLLLALLLLSTVREGRNTHRGRIFMAIYCTIGLLLLLAQQRLGEIAAPAMALLIAAGLAGGWKLARLYLLSSRHKIRPFLLVSLLAIGTGLAILAPVARAVVHFVRWDGVERNEKLVEFGRKLAATIGDNEEPEKSGGLLCHEIDSNPLLYSFGRPVVAASFPGTRSIQQHNARAYRILLEPDESKTTKELEKLRVKYVVVSPLLSRLEAMTVLAEINKPMYERYRTFQKNEMVIRLTPLPNLLRALHTRLLVGDGSAGSAFGTPVAALRHFRLLLESGPRPQQPYPIGPYFKAFEFVEGARITGDAPPRSDVFLRLGLVTNTGRGFTYRAKARADEAGRFEFVVPYPTGKTRYPVRAVTPYRIKVGHSVYHLEVPEKAVLEGGEIPLSHSVRVLELPDTR